MSVLKRTIPSAALLVLGLVALLVVAAGGMFLAKASGGGGWGGAGAASWGASAASGKADVRIGDKTLFDDTGRPPSRSAPPTRPATACCWCAWPRA
jgi:hypothetical protein